MTALPQNEDETASPMASEGEWAVGEAISFETPIADDDRLDDDDEDTVFLAPRLDFTPGGALCRGGDQVDAEIESPFAKGDDKTVDELMSPQRQVEDLPEAPAEAFPEAKLHHLDPAAPARTQIPLPPLPSAGDGAKPSIPLTSPSIAPLPIKPLSKAPPSAPQAPTKVPLPSTMPTLTKPRPVRPPLVQPPPEKAGAALFDGDHGRPADVDEETTSSADVLPADDTPEADLKRATAVPWMRPNPKISGEGSLTGRRSISADQSTPMTPQPAISEVLDLPSVSRVSRRPAVARIASGWGAVSTKLVAGWDAYSRGCRRFEARLARWVRQAGIDARKLMAKARPWLARLGRSYVADLQVVAALLRRVAGLAVSRISMASKRVLSAWLTGISSLFRASRRVARAVAIWLSDLTGKVRPRSANGDEGAVDALGSDEASQRNARAEALKAAAKLAITSNPKRVALPPHAKSDPQPSIAPSKAKVTDQAPGSGSPWRSLGVFVRSMLSPMRLTFGGLAAASLGFLFLAFGPASPGASARSVLTVRIPEKPYPSAADAKRLEPPVAALSPDETQLGEGASVTLSLSDPIAEMLSYVDERSLAPLPAAGLAPVLTTAGGIEGLGQFSLAAERVGLSRLLEPDQSYTFFIPNDAAFAKLPSGDVDRLLQPAGHERLLTLLSHHIVPKRLAYNDMVGGVRTYTSLAGQPMTIDASKLFRIGDAGMVEFDIQTKDGVIHVIDQVLPVSKP